MSTIAILVPVLARPGNVEPLLESVARSSTISHRVLFVCSEGDAAEIEAVRAAGADMLVVDLPPGHGSYAKKINLAYEATDEPWLFLGADDLRFEPYWDAECLSVADATGARVIGTNDDANPLVRRGKHSTHSLVARSYARDLGTIDEPGKILHEGYWHLWVDNELVSTARHRGEWAFARNAVVRHLHPIFDASVVSDATYELGSAQHRRDQALFARRSRLWRSGRRRAA